MHMEGCQNKTLIMTYLFKTAYGEEMEAKQTVLKEQINQPEHERHSAFLYSILSVTSTNQTVIMQYDREWKTPGVTLHDLEQSKNQPFVTLQPRKLDNSNLPLNNDGFKMSPRIWEMAKS